MSHYFKLLLSFWLICNSFSSAATCDAKVSADQLHRFETIDAHALNASPKVERSIATLASYLAASAKNDTEKARAIFRWVTHNITYDIKGLRNNRVGDLSPEGVLKSRSSICSGYAGLFQSLAQAAGLEAVTIKGYSKGYGYSAGAGFRSTNHAWNAVKIKGKWRLIDSTWGAGYINERGNFTRRFNDHFFLTKPEDFIYDHFPENPRWQLLDKPISMRQYQDFVYLKPAFFYTGIAVGSHKKSTIKTGNNITVTLKTPTDTLLLALLEQSGRKLDSSYTFLQRKNGEYAIHAQLPRPGTYTLRIFARLRQDGGKYAWAMDYKILANKGFKQPIGFPKIFGEFVEKNAYLISPLRGSLKSGTRQVFKIRTPGAQEVAVKIGSTWYDLKKEKGIFSGKVPIKKGEVLLMAKYPENEQYSGLLQYSGY